VTPNNGQRLRIAIVGGGVSGLVCAWLLHDRHDIVVFEANDYAGGHTNTVRVDTTHETHAIDTGFIVFNHRTYPNFTRLLDRLDVPSDPSSMSFSVHCERTGLEYNGTNLNALFAQRVNLIRPSFHRMLREIMRFGREAPELLAAATEETLSSYLERRDYSRAFVDNYLIPMGAAIWSTDPELMLRFPARFFVEFFANHGMLDLHERPQWRVIRGGSQRYVEKLMRPFHDRIHLRTKVTRVRRDGDAVRVKPAGGPELEFDRVIFATHSDITLAMLADPSEAEREILTQIPYQRNRTALHTDTSLLPERKRAWASWNYRIPSNGDQRLSVTYHMNRLQSLTSRNDYCVTLNSEGRIAADRIVYEQVYEHPLYTVPGTRARARKAEISGVNNTYYCGAYWGNGFHEDGVVSALDVCAHFGRGLDA